MQAPSPTTVVVTLNWNGSTDTIACVESIEQTRTPDVGLIVVDNGSRGPDVEAVRAALARRPWAELICNTENLGFAEGCNIGIERALDMGAQYIFLLNNDAVVVDDALTELVAFATATPDAGLVAPLILDASGSRIWAAGGVRSRREVVCRLGLTGEPASRAPAAPFDAYALTGCALLVRRDVIESVGAFDPLYFAYVEDVDLSVRARAAGWRAVVVPTARVLHRVSAASGGGYNPVRGYLLGRGTAIFVRKRADFDQKLGFALAAPIGLVAAGVREAVGGRLATVVAKARGYVDGLRLRPVDKARLRAANRPDTGPADR